MKKRYLWAALIAIVLLKGSRGRAGNSQEIINASYDASREFYMAYNEIFTDYLKETTGKEATVIQSHGGSGKQALEVANGLGADVVTLALEGDVDAVLDAGLIEQGYTKEFAYDSSPYHSTIVFLVRRDNPKKIYDWNDLLKDDVEIITPNPKTSGAARWNYLAAWYYFEKQGFCEETIKEKVKKIYENVLVLDAGARGSTTTFAENGQGDVLLTWENEAFLTLLEKPGEFEIVAPSASILCQPTVAIVDEVVDYKGTRELATQYLSYLYSEEAQKLEAAHYYRPSNKEILLKHEGSFANRVIREIPKDGKWIITDMDTVGIEHFGGWKRVIDKHFLDGGIFDSLYE